MEKQNFKKFDKRWIDGKIDYFLVSINGKTFSDNKMFSIYLSDALVIFASEIQSKMIEKNCNN